MAKSHRIEMRLMGTDHKILEILEESDPYKNRGESLLFRVYLKVNLDYPD